MNSKDSAVFTVYRLTFIVMSLYLRRVPRHSETRLNKSHYSLPS